MTLRQTDIGLFLLTGASLTAMVLANYLSSLDLYGVRSCPMPESEMGRFVRVEGGGFIKGADAVYPEEETPQKIFVSPFYLQVHEVTNNQFASFVVNSPWNCRHSIAYKVRQGVYDAKQ